MITSHQMRAGRALLQLDQREFAQLSQLSLPTIQRMEASDGQVRGVVDTLVKVVDAFEAAGVELIGSRAPSAGRGCGVRLRKPQTIVVAQGAERVATPSELASDPPAPRRRPIMHLFNGAPKDGTQDRRTDQPANLRHNSIRRDLHES
jgi:hypothetical protein